MTGRPEIAPAAPAVLTGHELRALARARRWTLPPLLAGEPGDDEPEHDLVAMRGLLARGVVAFAAEADAADADDDDDHDDGAAGDDDHGDRLVLTAPASARLAPFDAVERIVEVDLDDGAPVGGERHVLVAGTGATLCLSEAVADVWVVTPADTVDAVVARLRAALAAAPAPPPPGEHPVAVDGATHAWIDALVAAGAGADSVAANLVEAGVGAPAAHALAAALVAAARVASVRAAARHDDAEWGEGLVAREACWIEAPGGWWAVTPATVDEEQLLVPVSVTDGPPEPFLDPAVGDRADGVASTFTPTDPARVLALLDDVLATEARPA